MQFVAVQNFDEWREAARRLLAAEKPPHAVHWGTAAEQPLLFAAESAEALPAPKNPSKVRVPPAFLDLARQVACHADPGRWELLYRTLWRLTHGERQLLEIATDDDVYVLQQMDKAVARDVHKMHAFVRFRKVVTDGKEQFIAWHRPDHRIVRLAAPFFSRRFVAMHWTILTPQESVWWDQRELHYGPGVPVTEAPDRDALEDLWRTYYGSIFNPARIKTAMMKREMPVRHWATLPETTIIPELLQQAPARVETMLQTHEGFVDTAARFFPEQTNLPSLAAAAACCQACDLYQHATQAVFGDGPADARMVLVGEQPGDQEDLAGRPFVGPAGQLLDQALEQAGISRDEVYTTNVVKHFSFTERGKRRLHKKPGSREIFACRPWLEAELTAIRPETIVCLGATAAQALLGRDFRITQRRGNVLASDWSPRTIATWHPAAILRQPDAQRRDAMFQELSRDLALARRGPLEDLS